MGSFIRYKPQKVQAVLKTLGEGHTPDSFAEAFKVRFPEDWQLIQAKWQEEETSTPPGKGHPMQPPEVYLREMYRNHKEKTTLD